VVLVEGIRDVLEEDQAENDGLYSAASMLLRSLPAASQSVASKPRFAEESLERVDL
jgi:hypothetical protein